MDKVTFFSRFLDLLDSLSASELLITDFLSEHKKKAIVYILATVFLCIIIYFVKNTNVSDIVKRKKEADLKTYTYAKFWKEKAQVPYLRIERFREEALRKLVPLLSSFVKNNNIGGAYIVDNKSNRIMVHNDTEMINNDYQIPDKRILSLMDKVEITIGSDQAGDVIKTKISMIVYKKGKHSILRTYGAIPYGKARRTIGIFVIESSYDATKNLIDDQNKYVPLFFIMLFLAVPAALFIEYYIRARMIRQELLGYDGKYIGLYKDIQSIGEGSMGKVYQATRMLKGKSRGRKVALKVINKNLYNKKGFLKRFKNEAQVVARLGMHRNIVGFFDFGQVKIEGEESFGLEMPFIDSVPLDKTIEKYNNDISVGQALYIGLEILNGLNHAHTLKDDKGEITPIIHRDISPKNILLAYNGSVLIADFGIAKSNDIASMTLAGELLGTFTNMSPEQANGDNIDCRSDIFSLGTVLYELLLKKKLYQADDIRILWNLVSKAEIPEISGLEEGLKRILLTSLAKKPSDRYQTAVDMMNDIRAVISQKQDYHFDEKAMESFLHSRL